MSDGHLTDDAARLAGIGTARRLRRLALAPGIDAGAGPYDREIPLVAALRRAWRDAVEAQAHALAERMLRIGDGTDELGARYAATIDAAARDPVTGMPDQRLRSRLEMARVQRDRLRADNIRWYIGRTARPVWGDRVTHDGTVTHRAVVALPVIGDAPPPPLRDGATGTGDGGPVAPTAAPRPVATARLLPPPPLPDAPPAPVPAAPGAASDATAPGAPNRTRP